MSSNNLSLLDDDSFNISSEALSDKETQTSNTYITDSFNLVKGPSRPLPKGIDKSQVEPTVHNILDCRVIKDLSNTKSTDLQAESFIKDIAESNASKSSDKAGTTSPTSLRYCQEVVKPYLNTNLKDCDESIESLENIILNGSEDLPCYEVYEGQKDIEEKTKEISTSRMDTIPNEINNQNEGTPKNSTDNRNVPENPDDSMPKSPPNNINIIKSNSKNKVDLSRDKTNHMHKDEEINRRSISMESISKCTTESFTALKQSASSCLDKVEIVIGIKKPENSDEKPTYYAKQKTQTDIGPSHNVQTDVGNSFKSLFNGSCEKICTFKDACKGFAVNLMNNHNEKISAVKETCKDFAENLLNIPDDKIRTVKETCKNYADKLYNTSKDAITLLSNESVRILTKSNTELDNKSDSNVNQQKQKEKKISNISADSITSFLFKKAENKPVNNDPPIDKAITGTSKITDTIPPEVKLSFNKLKDDIVSAKLEKSSSYDIPLPKETTTKTSDSPETRMPTVSAIDHTPDPPTPPNMFAIITSKIFSMFSDESDRATEPIIQENEDEEEEDPFEKFMEQ